MAAPLELNNEDHHPLHFGQSSNEMADFEVNFWNMFLLINILLSLKLRLYSYKPFCFLWSYFKHYYSVLCCSLKNLEEKQKDLRKKTILWTL